MHMATEAIVTPPETLVAESSAERAEGEGGPGSLPDIAIMIATAPFDNFYGDADVILRSADGADFYVHKNILRFASAFFADMFSLPQPLQASSEPSDGDILSTDACSDSTRPLPVISVSENWHDLDNLLRMCYPVEKPTGRFATVQGISPLLEGALKYQMREATTALTRELMALCPSRPLDVFAEAYSRGLEEVAKHAARAFSAAQYVGMAQSRISDHQIDDFVPAMDNIPASLYYRLLDCHSGGGHPDNIFQNSAERAKDGADTAMSGPPPSMPSHPFKDPAQTNMVIRSSDGMAFYVLRKFISFSSPVIGRMLREKQDANADSEDNSASASPRYLPLLQLPEDGRTLAVLLQLCYPIPDPEMKRTLADDVLNDACRLYDSAKKYEVTRAVEYAKRRCVAEIDIVPDRVYFIASKYDWEDVMKEAAWHSVYESSDGPLERTPEMANATAATYRRLLLYRQKCRDIILKHHIVSSMGHDSGFSTYWCIQEPWLDGSKEENFWKAIHQQVWRNTTPHGLSPSADIEVENASRYLRSGTSIMAVASALAKVKL
ncbi:uncharacterized protein C8Q71DRAFT_753656 [Rhodofomes roseus]|uniref:BTB domain-containing protein n=1 Tax=Rhodofomes roseus TaxID=34475 RepID=A0ABQ8KI26_9APHY|nr:uncharacterized protein C8Q71DRAFT_753656 [Rhodofomes roseus]KAH9837628.1 hypothetical protein C8Q71DRAFT_753656 [Rhodofomes roseus]